MIERQVDGLILADGDAARSGPGRRDRTRPAPVVLMNRTDETGRAPAVINDDIRGIGLAVRHLAALGHTPDYPHRGPGAGSRPARCGARGFQLAMYRVLLRGRKPSVIEAEAFTREAGRAACLRGSSARRRTPPRSSPPTICSRSAATTRSTERNVSCPDEMSITGYNDAPFVDMVSPPLTTVRIRQREMGIEAARVLLARMNGQEIAADVLLRPELIVRRSTAAPRKLGD